MIASGEQTYDSSVMDDVGEKIPQNISTLYSGRIPAPNPKNPNAIAVK